MNYRHLVYLAPFALLSITVKAAIVEEMADVSHLRDTIENNENVVIKVYADWCGHCKHAEVPFRDLAGEHKTNIKSVAINADNQDLKPIIEKFGVTGFPTFIFIKKEGTAESTPDYKEIKIIELSEKPLLFRTLIGFSHENLKTHMKEFGTKIKKAAQAVKKTLIGEGFSLKEAHTMADLKKTVDNAFKHGKHVVIKVETPWCGACKQAAPEFRSLMEKYHNKLQGTIVDGENSAFTTLLGKKLKIQAYPSFIFIRKDAAKGFEELDFEALHDSPVYVNVVRGFSELFKRDLAVLAGVEGAKYVTVTTVVEEPAKEVVKAPVKKAKKPIAPKTKKAAAKKHVKKHVEPEAEPDVCPED